MRLPLVACLLGISTLASAQPGADDALPPPPPYDPAPPYEPAPPPPPPAPPAPIAYPQPPVLVVAPPVSSVDKGVIEDANSGRNWLTPTALTPPAGTWSFSDFELFLISGSYAVTDELSISATTLLPIVDDMPFFGIGSAKLQVIKSGNVRAAVQAAVMHISESGSDSSVTVGNLGGAVTLCIDSDCHSHLTGYLGAGFAQEDNSAVPFVAALGATLRLTRRVKAVFEADTAFIAGDINDNDNGLLVWYGVRFTSREIGVDLGFAKPLCSGCEDGLAMGIPFVSFTYRAFKGD